MRTAPWLTAFAMLSVHASCADLGEIALDICGNGVIDVERGERCDQHDEYEGSHCALRGEPNECRYVCVDRLGDGYLCPPGWGCGADDVCRPASGNFHEATPVALAAGNWVSAGDVDGDGYDDVASSFGTRLEVSYFERGALADSYQLPLDTNVLKPSAGDMNVDGRLDLVVPNSYGVSVLFGDATRKARPGSYASIPRPESISTIIDIDLVPDVVDTGLDVIGAAGHEPIVITAGGDVVLLAQGVFSESQLPSNIGDLLFELPVAAFDTELAQPPAGALGLSREQFVLAGEGSASLRLMRPVYSAANKGLEVSVGCAAGAAAPCLDAVPITLLPATAIAHRIIATHANPEIAPGVSALVCNGNEAALGDDHLDLVIGTTAGPYIAYGLGNGHFHGSLCDLDEVVLGSIAADDTARPGVTLETCESELHAAADIDGDGLIDTVSNDAVRLSGHAIDVLNQGLCHPGTTEDDPTLLVPLDKSSWTDARIVDIDGDGDRDVVAASDTPSIDIIRWGDGAPNYSTTPVGALAAAMTIGDYDANGIEDVAVAERYGAGDRDRVAVIFGEPFAAPSPPQQVAVLADVSAMVRTRLGDGFANAADGTDDLLVGAGAGEMAATALMQGRTDRQLQAPYFPQYEFDPGTRYAALDAQLVADGYDLDGAPLAQRFITFGINLAPSGSYQFFGLSQAEVGEGGQLRLLGEEPEYISITPDLSDLLATRLVRLRAGQGAPDLLALLRVDASGNRSTFLSVIGLDGSQQGLGNIPKATLFEGVSLASRASDASRDGNAAALMDLWSTLLNADPRGCDLDASGRDALVLMFLGGQACGDDALDVQPLLRVIPAEAIAAQSSDANAVGALMKTVELPLEETLMSFTCGNTDADAADELVFVTVSNPVPTCNAEPFDGSWMAESARVYRVELVDGVLTPPALIATLTSKVAPSLAQPSVNPPISSVVIGDFDGDGVSDLLLGANQNSALLLGEVASP